MTGIQGPDSARQERLTVLIRRYEKDILRICYLYLHELEQSKDAVQETFLKAYIHLDRLQDPSKEKSWLTKIAVNICRDHLRSPWVTHMNRYVQPEDLRIATEQENETHTALTAAVMSLPRKYMEAIMLRSSPKSRALPAGTASEAETRRSAPTSLPPPAFQQRNESMSFRAKLRATPKSDASSMKPIMGRRSGIRSNGITT